ncbi:MAG TPA: alpha-glucan family phosphorylase [Thermodesulfobacteriota bacterium]|nr:alpha-glucan family phosphorylase [Thermodesulfobacteriota bacterium]
MNNPTDDRSIAYFSMEIALEAGMPTYSGGLGVLAGDTIRSAADLRVPMVAVTLLHRKGYFYQRLDANGWQTEEAVEWAIGDFLEEMPGRVSLTLEGRTVFLRCWKYEVSGIGGFNVPVYFLDTDVSENSEWDRTLTHFLYGGDQRYRLCQEVVLGIGGVRMLRALGYYNIERFHMNEGHSSLLTLELLDEEARKAGRETISRSDIELVRRRCVFTTHTPVPAGHDQFPLDLVARVLGRREVFDMKDVFCCENLLNMTFLGFNLSHYINGVAKKHGEVSRLMFAGYKIDAITNGVHAATWVSKPFQGLFDRYLPGWREDNFNLRYALKIPREDVWRAHAQAKERLIRYVNRSTNAGMDMDVLTIGFARRATTYKRGDLLFTDIERIKGISSKAGPFQVVYSGKAHPQDRGGKEVIKRIFDAKNLLRDHVRVVYLNNYDLELAKVIIPGVDVWLNTPQPPLEASGTSGMKAAMNGVPSLSVLDGWWIEGHIEGVTGWSIGENEIAIGESHDSSKDALYLYEKLERDIIPLFYRERDRFIDMMRYSIALNGSFFNTQRMLQQYVLKAYFT